jgi:hypothetical protein
MFIGIRTLCLTIIASYGHHLLRGKPRAVVGHRIVCQLAAGDDGIRVEMRVRGEIVGLDVVEVDGCLDLGHLRGRESAGSVMGLAPSPPVLL